MPQAIPAAATAFAKWATAAFISATGATGLGTAQAVYAVAYATAYVGSSALVTVGLGAFAAAQVPDVETGKLTRKQPRPLRCFAVGGPSRMAGPYMLRESKGNKFAGVLALCEGRLASIDRIYLNDDLVTLSGGYVQGMANERYGTGDLVRLDYRLGLPTETHYGFLSADFAAEWPTTSRGDGIASLGWLAQHRSNESFPRHFPNGEILPSAVGVPVCYDWRDPTQDREDESTWKASWNPVVWLVHVEWTRHGRSWSRCIAPVLSELTAEADYCDEVVDRGPVSEARYRCAGNYLSNVEPAAVRSALLACMDGWMSFDGKGRLVIKAGRYTAPDFTLTAEHIEGCSWQAFQIAEEAINALAVSYTSADHDYTEVEAGQYRVEAEITAIGREIAEPLQLSWVPSAAQAMHLARRKMSRLSAPRRGSVRTGVYGLNGLGRRYIRVQNPMLASMADVVVEVTDVRIDFARGQVVFDVIQADETLDDDETVTATPPPPVTRPSPSPGYQDPADPPIWKSEPFPIQIEAPGTLGIAAFTARRGDGSEVALPADTILGMDDETTYGLFWREDAGYEVEAWPADAHMATGSWLFLGWHTTPGADGGFTVPAAPPPGYAGEGAAPRDEYSLLRTPGGGVAGALALKDTAGAEDIDDGAVSAEKIADGAVDLASAKVVGKSLANIDLPAATKLGGIQEGAQVNPASLSELDPGAATKLDGLPEGSELSPLATAVLPTSPSGLSAGDLYLDGATPKAVTAAVVGAVAKELIGSTGSPLASATASSVAAGSLIEISGFFDAPALDDNAPMTGTITFEEGTGGAWSTLGAPQPVTIDSTGESLPGGGWNGSNAWASVSVFGTRSGEVTYRATFTRTGGSNLHGIGYAMSGVVKITPTV